jgi:hypothetical protein
LAPGSSAAVAAEIQVPISRGKIKNSPAYLPSKPVSRDYEDQLCEYYGVPKYWDKE